MSFWVQVIAVPVLLAFSVAFFLFCARASERRRVEAEAERLAPPPPEAADGQDPAPAQSSNISTVKK